MSNIRNSIIAAHSWLGTARDSFDEGRMSSHKRAKAQIEKAIVQLNEAVASLDKLIADRVGQANLPGFGDEDDIRLQ